MFGENEFEKIRNHQGVEKNIESDAIMKELLERIMEIQHQENFIGEGATAKVFASKTNPNICYKIIHSEGDCGFRNPVDEEADILEKAEKISRQCNVKVPKPYYSMITNKGDRFEVLIMERIHALSLREILEGNLDVDESFDYKKFVEKIDIFFSKLHEQNIYHRDAHWGNIMIEIGTNTPCIIDFGASTELLISSEDPYKIINYQNTTTFTPDEHRIREEIRIKFRTYLFKKYGNIHNL